MKNSLLFFFLAIPFMLSAQFGLHTTFQNNTNTTNLGEIVYNTSGFAVGIDYTFKLAQNRVEFFPELNYSAVKMAEPIFEVSGSGISSRLESQAIGFYFNTNVYPFDFEGDCDCPVFSKDGNFFKKGFFLQVSPGVNYHNYQYEEFQDISLNESRILKGADFSYSLAGGAGIDIGLSEHLTISPYFRARYHFDTEMESYFNEESTPARTDSFAMWQMNAGLRIGVLLTDEFTRNKRMRSRRENKRTKKTKKRRY